MKVAASAWFGAASLGLALLGGCAVQTAPGGGIRVDIDEAELLGKPLASFPLADGGEGLLRVLNGSYSLKLLPLMKVVPVRNATAVRLLMARPVGGRTLVVLEKSEWGCASRTQVLAIQGTEVLSWDIGDCSVLPTMVFGPDTATFDFVQQRRVMRFTYRDARLLRSESATTPDANNASATAKAPWSLFAPAAAAASAPAAAPALAPLAASQPRYLPGPPIAVEARPAAIVAAPPRRDAAPAAAPPPAPAPALAVRHAGPSAPAPKALDFPAQEQRPVRIILDQ